MREVDPAHAAERIVADDTKIERRGNSSWLISSVVARKSEIEGSGLFATVAIYEGDVVAVMGGQILSVEEFQRVRQRVTKLSAAAIDEDRHILHEEDTPLRFGNHSCD